VVMTPGAHPLRQRLRKRWPLSTTDLTTAVSAPERRRAGLRTSLCDLGHGMANVEIASMATLGETRPVVWPRAFSLVVETITGWPGGSRGWWLDHGAADEDLDTWQQKL